MLARYVIRRVLASVPTLFGVTLVSYFLIWITAGDIVPGLEINPNIRQEDIDRIRHNLGLDQPFWIQYLNWLGLPNLAAHPRSPLRYSAVMLKLNVEPRRPSSWPARSPRR